MGHHAMKKRNIIFAAAIIVILLIIYFVSQVLPLIGITKVKISDINFVEIEVFKNSNLLFSKSYDNSYFLEIEELIQKINYEATKKAKPYDNDIYIYIKTRKSFYSLLVFYDEGMHENYPLIILRENAKSPAISGSGFSIKTSTFIERIINDYKEDREK